MYHEPTLGEMLQQSDGWAWVSCDACGRRGAVFLTIAARRYGVETGIIAFARKLRCGCGKRRAVVQKPISAPGEPLWLSPSVPLRIEPEEILTDEQAAERADPAGYAAWQRLSRMRWYVGPDVALAGAIRDVRYFLERGRAGASFSWLAARRAVMQLSRRDHYLINGDVRAEAKELDELLRRLGETEDQRKGAVHSESWAASDGPMPTGKPWKRRDHLCDIT